MSVMAVAPFVLLLVVMLLGVPIAVSLAISGMLGIYLINGDIGRVMGIVSMTPFSSVADYSLSTIPMFILMAYLSAGGGLARDLYAAAASWMAPVRGGLAIATVFACGIFGAMSGASTAAATAMSQNAMPEMRRHGYSDPLAAGAIGVGATLDILIPPSIAMVIYAVATQTSIGKLLIAGIIPGIVVGLLLALTIYVWAVLRPQDAPRTAPVSSAERWAATWRVWPSLLLILVVIGLLYTGVATPTETGAIGAFAAASIGFATGRLNFDSALKAVKDTLATSAMIFLILIGATIFGYYMALSRIPQHAVEAVAAMQLNRWLVIIAIVVAYFIISMFMDEIPLLLLTLQLTFPMVVSLGFDPIWFGVMSMLMVSMGLVFPPVGMIAFVVSAAGKVPLTSVYKGTSVLMFAILATTVLLMIFPQIALWLPATMK